jgi:hypothetical protein
MSLEDVGNTDYLKIQNWYLNTAIGNVLKIDRYTILIHL